MPLYNPPAYSGRTFYTSAGQFPSLSGLGDAGYQRPPMISRPGQPSTQFTYQDVNAGGGFNPGPTRDWQAISDSEATYRDEPNDPTPGKATLTMVGPTTRPQTQTKEYTHMDLGAKPQVMVPSVAVRNSNFNPSEAGVDDRRGVWRMPVGGQSFLGTLDAQTVNMLQIGGVIAGVLVLIAGIALYRKRHAKAQPGA